MSYKTHARHGSATMPHGITAERSRVDLNAFLIICYAWHTLRVPPALPEPKPGALARVA
jgi:hypothetical protein